MTLARIAPSRNSFDRGNKYKMFAQLLRNMIPAKIVNNDRFMVWVVLAAFLSTMLTGGSKSLSSKSGHCFLEYQ